MSDTEVLARIEKRLARLENHLGLDAPATPEKDSPSPTPTAEQNRQSTSGNPLATAMAVVAGIALILAVVYFVRLAYNAGWLTPPIQIGFALLTGIGLIAGGVILAHRDRDYAAYLPAVGLIVLFLSIYAAHLTYNLIPQLLALAAVAATSLTGLWLSRRFSQSVYGIFSAVGVYLTPLLLPDLRAETVSLLIYFSAWSLLFSFVALTDGRRLIYVVAMFLALLGFDFAWRLSGQGDWVLAASYQAIQFLIFAATATAFSIIKRQPMTSADAAAHGVGLLYFYLVEYVLLKQNAPSIAPWVALASAALLLGAFLFARTRSDAPLKAGATLVSSYVSLVTAHVVFFEFASDRYIALLALLFPAVGLLLRQVSGNDPYVTRPAMLVSAAVFAMGFFAAIVSGDSAFVPLFVSQGGLLLLYAAALYGGFWFARRQVAMQAATPFLLYSGHIAALIASTALIDNGLLLSLLWAAVAVALLLYAVRARDVLLGRSALLIFLAGALKILLFDLAGADPLIRVVLLVVLAASLYAGGWLYQKLDRGIERLHPNDEVNRQLNAIRDLARQEPSDEAVAAALTDSGVPYLGEGGSWDAETVGRIVRDYSLRG